MPTTSPPAAPTFHQYTLEPGLNLLVESDPSAHTAAIGFFVNAGTRDEPAELMGVSHFLEHMMFKGTARRSAEDINREFDELGADYNAYTSHEHTVYHAHVLPEHLEAATDLLADMLRPRLADEDFAVEKQVILEEIAMYDDRPDWRLFDRLQEAHFGTHALGYRVLGTPQTVGDMTADQMRGYYRQRYGRDTITVAAAGRVDAEALHAQLKQLTADWPLTQATRDTARPSAFASEQTIEDPNAHRQYVALMWPGPSAQSEQRHAARVLAELAGDSDGSRLYWALVDPGHADEADLSYQPMDGTGALCVYVSCDPERAADVEHKLRDVLAKLHEDLTEDEVMRARTKLATSLALAAERPSGLMHRLGEHWLYHREYITLAEYAAQLEAVTVEDVREVAEAYPALDATTVRLTPTECS